MCLCEYTSSSSLVPRPSHFLIAYSTLLSGKAWEHGIHQLDSYNLETGMGSDRELFQKQCMGGYCGSWRGGGAHIPHAGCSSVSTPSVSNSLTFVSQDCKSWEYRSPSCRPSYCPVFLTHAQICPRVWSLEVRTVRTVLVSQARPNQPQRWSLSVSRRGKVMASSRKRSRSSPTSSSSMKRQCHNTDDNRQAYRS